MRHLCDVFQEGAQAGAVRSLGAVGKANQQLVLKNPAAAAFQLRRGLPVRGCQLKPPVISSMSAFADAAAHHDCFGP